MRSQASSRFLLPCDFQGARRRYRTWKTFPLILTPASSIDGVNQRFYDIEEQWFLMEDAPQDGTEILVYDEKHDRISLVAWESARVYYPGAEDEVGWKYPYSEQDEQGGAMFVERPTCWQHVPKKPKKPQTPSLRED